PLPACARRHPLHPAVRWRGAEGDRALLEHDGAAQALCQRARRGHARGAELALDPVAACAARSSMTDAETDLPVLALNSGSSSLKFGLYRVEPSLTEVLISGETGSDGDGGTFQARDASGRQVAGDEPLHSMRDALARIARLLADRGLPAPAIIGHRVVHGGAQLRRHCLIDEAVLRQLRAARAFAPLHVPQAACFDTAFHAGLPEVARRLPIPKALHSAGVQRYGFHGLSCESIVRQLG